MVVERKAGLSVYHCLESLSLESLDYLIGCDETIFVQLCNVQVNY